MTKKGHQTLTKWPDQPRSWSYGNVLWLCYGFHFLK